MQAWIKGVSKICRFSSQALDGLPLFRLVDIPLAQTGEGIAECELLKWFVQEVKPKILFPFFHFWSFRENE